MASNIYDNDLYDVNNVHSDQQERGTANNDLDFNSFYQKQFENNQNLMHSGNQKQMFTNITVNLFVPRDTSLMKPSFDLDEILEDEPEKLIRL